MGAVKDDGALRFLSAKGRKESRGGQGGNAKTFFCGALWLYNLRGAIFLGSCGSSKPL